MLLNGRTAKPGVCVEGKCLNGKCEGFNKIVISSQGMGRIDVQLDLSKFKCPCCSKTVQPLTCAFNNCYWWSDGLKSDGNVHRTWPNG